MYRQNGVYIDEATLYEGRKTKLKYNGNLIRNGAEEIHVHLGFGLLWENLTEIKMTKRDNHFEAEIPLIKSDSLNFCFRDNYNNWDNNSYQNYIYDIKKLSKHEPMILQNNSIKEINLDSINVNNKITKKRAKKGTMIQSLDLTKNYSSTIEAGCSLVPIINSEFNQYRKLPENYIRNKKMRILFYRMFAYVPRLLNGYNKKRMKNFINK